MINLDKTFAEAKYQVDEADIEKLANQHYKSTQVSDRADATYLRILVAGVQSHFGPVPDRKRKDLTKNERTVQATYLSELQGKYYAAVLRGVTDAESVDVDTLPTEERRRRAKLRATRANFAASAASTLQSYIKHGGDVRSLNVNEVTKYSLQAFIGESQGYSYNERIVSTSLQRIESNLRTLAHDDAEQAFLTVKNCIQRLESLMHEIEKPKPKQRKAPKRADSREQHQQQPVMICA
jgi:hypothetical protein